MRPERGGALPPKALEQAAEWMMRRQQGSNREQDAQWQQWCDACPENQLAWERAERLLALAPGTRATVFDGPEGRFGVLICYEGIFPQVSRRFVHDGADFLVNITNDAWYGQTAAPYQHLAQATMRTVENRVPLVRAANTGISAIVGDDGRIVWAGPLDQLLEHTEAISWRGVRTFYTRFGDVFVWTCVATVVLAAIIGLRRRPVS